MSAAWQTTHDLRSIRRHRARVGAPVVAALLALACGGSGGVDSGEILRADEIEPDPVNGVPSDMIRVDGMSNDGSTVFGAAGRNPFRWTLDDGTTELAECAPDGFALDCSPDGSVIVGRCGDEAFRWTAATGFQSLGEGRAIRVSSDGAIVIGLGPSGPFRWTPATGRQPLGGLPPGFVLADAAIDAEVLFGSLPGSQVLLDSVVGVIPVDEPSKGRIEWDQISRNGRVLIGTLFSGSEAQAVRWTKAGGIEELGFLPGDAFSSARALSADGSTIVGASRRDGMSSLEIGFLWTEEEGIRAFSEFSDKAAFVGRSVAGSETFGDRYVNAELEAVSGDGRFVAGFGVTSGGEQTGFRLELDP